MYFNKVRHQKTTHTEGTTKTKLHRSRDHGFRTSDTCDCNTL